MSHAYDPARHRRWYEQNRGRKSAAARAYFAENKAAIVEKRRAYRYANREAIRLAEDLDVSIGTARAIVAAERGEFVNPLTLTETTPC